MFDGNFRSRKEVNLGGRRRRNNNNNNKNNNKESLLKNAEASRKQRQEQIRKDRAARDIQKCLRAWLCRYKLSKSLRPTNNNNNNGESNHNDNVWSNVPASTITSMRLSSPLLYCHPPKQQKTRNIRRTIVLDYASTIQSNSNKDNDGIPMQQQQQISNVSLTRILQATLKECHPSQNTTYGSMALSSMFAVLQSHFQMTQPQNLNDLTFLHLIQCTQAWWEIIWKSTPPIQDETINYYMKNLWNWSQTFSLGPIPQTAPGSTSSSIRWPLLSSVLLGSKNLLHAEKSYFIKSFIPNLLSTNHSCFDVWVLPLASVLDPAAMVTDDPLMTATLQTIRGSEPIFMANALDLHEHATNIAKANNNNTTNANPQGLIQLIHHVLLHNKHLAIVSSLVAQGEDIDALSQFAQSSATTTATDNINDDFSSDEDDDDEKPRAPNAATQSNNSSSDKKSRITNNRYRRQDLLTVPKLDKLYKQRIQELKMDCFQNNDPAYIRDMLDLAQKINTGAPSTWLQWGLSLLDPSSVNESNAARDSYVSLLGILLQTTTGFRTSAKSAASPFLSALAFRRDFLTCLWQYVLRNQSSREALSIFCDIFCHYLMPLSDDDFLTYHASQQELMVNSQPCIIAEEVILHLRSQLYDLYWLKPVFADEINMDDCRGRLLLAGTKLWNALYERWNRLVNISPFCDESSWCFPHLSSRDGDGAVVASWESNRNNINDDSDSDDDLNVSGSERMDVDETDADGAPKGDAEADTLADSFRDPRMARILSCIPQALPFDRRVQMFTALVRSDKVKTQDEAAELNQVVRAMMNGEDGDDTFGNIRTKVHVHRDRLYHDSMSQLNGLGTKLKRKIQVSFTNQHGAEEAGIDGGGVFKEFLDDLIKEAFSSSDESNAPKLFSVTPSETLTVNADMNHPRMLQHYEFFGRVLGKAVYESILVEPQFCLPFLNQLLGKPNSLEDLKVFDPDFYKNLIKLRQMSDQEIKSLDLTFELTIGSKHLRSVELVPNGRHVSVTKSNLIHYIHLVAHQRLNVEGAAQTKAFLKGFRDLIPASWVRLFSANELQKLINGDGSIRGIDVLALQRAMTYAAGYHPSQPYIQDFWDIVQNEMEPEQQRKLLKFMTSCSRQPLLGFQSLDPPPCIQQIRLPEALFAESLVNIVKKSPLPTSSTCVNILKLPHYRNKDLLRQKLFSAIESGAGFELT